MAATTPRRGVLQGLGALGVGSLAVFGLVEAGSADVSTEGIRSCRRKCRRKCENRRPKCVDNCVKRKCQ
jgi:hypothetical protein